MARAKPKRPNQRLRTRKDLLRAAARLMKEGGRPTLEEIAEEALVSRATAYRYFSSADAVLLEASLDVAVPDPDEVFGADPSTDPVARVEKADAALHAMIVANEPAMRTLIANSLQQGLRNGSEDGVPARQNRRSALIEAALEPVRQQFTPAKLKLLKTALAVLIGPESRVVYKDVLQISDEEARKASVWAIRALVQAAMRSA